MPIVTPVTPMEAVYFVMIITEWMAVHVLSAPLSALNVLLMKQPARRHAICAKPSMEAKLLQASHVMHVVFPTVLYVPAMPRMVRCHALHAKLTMDLMKMENAHPAPLDAVPANIVLTTPSAQHARLVSLILCTLQVVPAQLARLPYVKSVAVIATVAILTELATTIVLIVQMVTLLTHLDPLMFVLLTLTTVSLLMEAMEIAPHAWMATQWILVHALLALLVIVKHAQIPC